MKIVRTSAILIGLIASCLSSINAQSGGASIPSTSAPAELTPTVSNVMSIDNTYTLPSLEVGGHTVCMLVAPATVELKEALKLYGGYEIAKPDQAEAYMQHLGGAEKLGLHMTEIAKMRGSDNWQTTLHYMTIAKPATATVSSPPSLPATNASATSAATPAGTS